MHLAILSRNKNLHSTRRLLKEGRARRIHCHVIDPLECQLIVDGTGSSIRVNNHRLPTFDAVLPRIGASITDYGLAVVKHFEIQGTLTVNGSYAIAESRDKLRCLQILAAAGVPVPATVLVRGARNIRAAVEAVKGFPAILKVLKGTQGVGVMIVHSTLSMSSVIDTIRSMGQDVLIQQFIAEGAGRDYRAFVVGDKVVAAMMRTAAEGEFRSNIHRGGEGKLVRLPPEFERAALRAGRCLGLGIAGVDLMESNSGPLVLEVNSSPGFEGIEKATGLNIAGMIVNHIRHVVSDNRGRRSGKKKRR